MGIRQRIGELIAGSRQIVSEIIGRVMYVPRALTLTRTDDWTQADYAWYDNLRRGKLKTYRLGALFAKPIVEHIASWSFDDGFRAITDDDTTNESLSTFVDDNLSTIISWTQDAMHLGDAFLIVNADGTLSAVPSNQVTIKTNPLDYRKVESYTITSMLAGATVIDTYTLTERVVTIKRGGQEDIYTYPNQTGLLPVIHLAYARGVNEVYGHPIHEALVPLYGEYDDVILNSLTGVKTMSNPVPSLEKVADPGAELDAIASRKETYIDDAGNLQTENVIDMDQLQMIATTGEFNYKAPSPFTADSWQMLKAMFLLMLQHSNVPEWVWGGAVASSKASVDAQMPAWEKFINLQRLMQFEPAIRRLIKVWLATVALYTPGVRTDLDLEIEWNPVAPADEAMHLNYVKQAASRGLITAETELRLLNLVKDAAAEIAAAQAEMQAEQAQRDQYGVAWDDALAAAQRAVDQREGVPDATN